MSWQEDYYSWQEDYYWGSSDYPIWGPVDKTDAAPGRPGNPAYWEFRDKCVTPRPASPNLPYGVSNV